MTVNVPFVLGSANEEYDLTVEVDNGRIKIIDVSKISQGQVIPESVKKFRKKLNRSDWKFLEDTLRHGQHI